MKLHTLFILLFISSFRLFSQDILFEEDITLKSVFNEKRESLPVVNESKNEIALFLLDNRNINGYLFDKTYTRTDKMATTRPESRYNTLLGHGANSAGYQLFFTNERKNQFLVKTLNFETKKDEEKIIPLKLRDEKFLETISYKNKFYLLTVVKLSSILKIYEFDGASISSEQEFDFSSYEFDDSSFSRLYDVFNQSTSPFAITLKVHKIDNRNPNPLDLTTQENKIYYYDDKFYITIDSELENTKLITIDLLDNSSAVKFYTQVVTECGSAMRVKSNSYLFQNNLFQIKGCKKELSFQIKDFHNDSMLKEFHVQEDEEIAFKNTPLIQEGGTTIFTQDSEKELENTKQVLRKISASQIGITVSKDQENIELTLGGFKEVQRTSGGGGMTMSSPGMTISTPGGTFTTPPTYHYNPTMYGYNSYTNTRSVYFKTLLDQQSFEHVKGEVSKNAYDQIREFEDDNDTDMTSQTIFKVDDYYVFGYYKKWKKKYYLRKFKDISSNL